MPLVPDDDRGAKIVRIADLSDTESVGAFRESLGILATGAGARIILDLSVAAHINSLGIGVLVNALRRVNEAGGRLVLEAPRENVRQLFRILGLDRIFLIVTTRDEALQALGLVEVGL
jgi:anti-anti-sigma factor